MRRFESLFYKINTSLQKTPASIRWQAEQIFFFKYIIHIFFQFWTWLLRSFSMLFPKAPASYCKTILNEFLLQCTSICISSKIVSDFKNLFQTGNINIFVLRGVLFSRYVQLKSLFSDEKKISSEI